MKNILIDAGSRKPKPKTTNIFNAFSITILLLFFSCQFIQAQSLNFEVSADELEMGETITISNQSEPLPKGCYFLFVFEECSFFYNSQISCSMQDTDNEVVFQGSFWKSGTYDITLYGINS